MFGQLMEVIDTLLRYILHVGYPRADHRAHLNRAVYERRRTRRRDGDLARVLAADRALVAPVDSSSRGQVKRVERRQGADQAPNAPDPER